jgi:hypothetical protein
MYEWHNNNWTQLNKRDRTQKYYSFPFVMQNIQNEIAARYIEIIFVYLVGWIFPTQHRPN